MAYETIEYAVAGAVATVTLNRPGKLNAFNVPMLEEAIAALQAAADDAGVRAVLLTANGRAFSAGQDLSERKGIGDGPRPDLGESLEKRYNPLVTLLRTMEKPVVCAVNGVAAGAGANIALACDLVLAARSAKFIEPFGRLGLVPDSGGSWSLPRLVGRARALGMLLTVEEVDAERAEAWGLIWKCIDDDTLMEEARALAADLAQKPTIGLGLIKRAINASHTNTLAEQLALEAELQRIAGYTEDYLEGVTAFFEKRKPVFKGR